MVGQITVQVKGIHGIYLMVAEHRKVRPEKRITCSRDEK